MAILFALVFTAQTQAMSSHALAMSMGIEICTAQGMKFVDPDGKPLPKESMQHDCCCIGTLGSAPTSVVPIVLTLPAAAPTSFVATRRLSAEWLAPLSRGPPQHS
ncbi:hypothetical protein BH10PSE17_BH10PSE17_15770 [soil metagenome]